MTRVYGVESAGPSLPCMNGPLTSRGGLESYQDKTADDDMAIIAIILVKQDTGGERCV